MACFLYLNIYFSVSIISPNFTKSVYNKWFLTTVIIIHFIYIIFKRNKNKIGDVLFSDFLVALGTDLYNNTTNNRDNK